MTVTSPPTTRSRPAGRFGGARLAAAVVLGGLVLGSCAGHVDHRGNRPEKSAVSQIKPGTSTRSEVVRLLGSPSTVAALDRNTWYYISKREEYFAFLRPTIKQQQVIEIRFNQAGVVQTMRQYGLKDAKEVSLVARQTPTSRREPGLLRQLYETITRGPLRPRPGAQQGVER